MENLVMEQNATLSQITDIISNITNSTELIDNIDNLTDVQLFDFYEAYLTREKEQLVIYKFVAYIIGSLIILSNIIVVVSSGLIIKKGQQPKSTYLLLGNVSLADTIIGVSIIFGTYVDKTISSNPLCIFQIGMIVCPTLVSIFSVGLIAIDRYIYILHGLYYQRWFNTTRVRIGIVCTWVIGITLGFMPVTGWTNQELQSVKCYYYSLFPGGLILLNALLSIIPVVVVVTLYLIILIRALRNVKSLKRSQTLNYKSKHEVKLRIYRGKTGIRTINNDKYMPNSNKNIIPRSASAFELKTKNNDPSIKSHTEKSISIGDLRNSKITYEQLQIRKNYEIKESADPESNLSVWTITSSFNDVSSSISNNTNNTLYKKTKRNKKYKEPNKWRAIMVVILTSGSFVATWLPFLIFIISFTLCENKFTNSKCLYIHSLLGGPLGTLAYLNSIFNPLIYAWWHKGFKKFLGSYFFRRFCKQTNREK